MRVPADYSPKTYEPAATVDSAEKEFTWGKGPRRGPFRWRGGTLPRSVKCFPGPAGVANRFARFSRRAGNKRPAPRFMLAEDTHHGFARQSADRAALGGRALRGPVPLRLPPCGVECRRR